MASLVPLADDYGLSLLDLGVGQPDPRILPVDIVRAAVELLTTQREVLQYGPEFGAEAVRRNLAMFLSAQYRSSVSADELLITSGSSFGLAMVCTLLAGPGDLIYVEEPTFYQAIPTLYDHHLAVESINMDREGLDVERLERRLKAGRRAGRLPKFLYTIPTYHNPTSLTMSVDRRQRLVELSMEYGFIIVADEVYHLLHLRDSCTPPPALSTFTESGTVVSLGSFSKILAPGLRAGWIHAAPELVGRLGDAGVIQSGGGLSPMGSFIADHAISTGVLDKYLRKLRKTYAIRSAAFTAALRKHLPVSVDFAEPDGGYFIWLRLPKHIRDSHFDELCASERVTAIKGSSFSIDGEMSDHLRVAFTYYDEPALEEAARRLATAISKYLKRA